MHDLDLTAIREALIREHMDPENRHDLEARHVRPPPATSSSERGIITTAKTSVRRYYSETRSAFPDKLNELIALHSAENAVFAEFVGR